MKNISLRQRLIDNGTIKPASISLNRLRGRDAIMRLNVILYRRAKAR